MKIEETRWMDMADLRALCIREGWFTRGDNAEYAKLLNMPYDAGEHRNMTTTALYDMAKTIMRYSDSESYDIIGVAGIMFSLAQICHTTFYVSEV